MIIYFKNGETKQIKHNNKEVQKTLKQIEKFFKENKERVK